MITPARPQPIAKLPPSSGRLPDFMIIGAAKSGTTTLYQYLLRHPRVFMSTPKEMSFFSKDEVYARGFDWYCSLFAAAGEHQLCGEASTTYSRWPTYTQAAERIALATPQVKLLYVLRNPVERLYSFYGHRMRERVTCDLHTFLAETPEAIDSGRYMQQISRYLEHFPASQIEVLFLEDLVGSPRKLLTRVGEFLGLEPFDYLADGDLTANPGGGVFYASQRLTRSIDLVKRVPLASSTLRLISPESRRRAFQWLQSGPIGQRLRKAHRQQLTPLTPAVRAQLYELFADDVEQLAQFTARDLSHWCEDSNAASSPASSTAHTASEQRERS
jgi:hypothetical protein